MHFKESQQCLNSCQKKELKPQTLNWDNFDDQVIQQKIWELTSKADIFTESKNYKNSMQCYKEITEHYKNKDLIKSERNQQRKTQSSKKYLHLKPAFFQIKGKNIYHKVPEGISIAKNEYGTCLVATKSFQKGEILYRGCYVKANEKQLQDQYDLIILGEANTTYKLYKKTNFVQDGDDRQVYGFDGFMNHSCNPTTISLGITQCVYDQIAARDINPGDQITVDYATFDYQCDGHQIRECWCGQKNCRKSMMGFKSLSLQQQLNLLPQLDPSCFPRFLADQQLIDYQELNIHENIQINFNFKDSQIQIHILKQTKQNQQLINYQICQRKALNQSWKGLYKTKQGFQIEKKLSVWIHDSEIINNGNVINNEQDFSVQALRNLNQGQTIILKVKTN